MLCQPTRIQILATKLQEALCHGHGVIVMIGLFGYMQFKYMHVYGPNMVEYKH